LIDSLQRYPALRSINGHVPGRSSMRPVFERTDVRFAGAFDNIVIIDCSIVSRIQLSIQISDLRITAAQIVEKSASRRSLEDSEDLPEAHFGTGFVLVKEARFAMRSRPHVEDVVA
jgi:hypothetical protein